MSWLIPWLAQPNRALKQEVVAAVKKMQSLESADLGPVFGALERGGPFARIRGGDLLLRLFEAWPEALEPYKAQVMGPLAGYEEIRCRWAYAKIAPFLAGTPNEAEAVLGRLEPCVRHSSGVLAFTALRGMVQLCRVSPELKERVAPLLLVARADRRPSVRGVAKQMLARLGLPPD